MIRTSQQRESYHRARAEQLIATEQRLEMFLEAEERRIGEISFGDGEDAQWHAKRILFEICVKVALRRSTNIEAYLGVNGSETQRTDIRATAALEGNRSLMMR
jgi:hypothetical protein